MSEINKENIVWEGCGVFPLFAIPIKSSRYTLYTNQITIEHGLGVHVKQNIKLHQILAKELITNPIMKFFNCGKIKLKVRGMPDLIMTVKNPDEVFQIIDETKQKENEAFIARQKNRKK